MSFESYKILEEKAVADSAKQNFYLRETTPRKRLLKRNVNYSYVENKNEGTDNSDNNTVNNNNTSKDNEI